MRGNMMPCAPQSSARRGQRILQIGYANYRTDARQLCDEANILNGFKVESAVFGIDEGPVETGCR
jgi:hypothetical protein